MYKKGINKELLNFILFFYINGKLNNLSDKYIYNESKNDNIGDVQVIGNNKYTEDIKYVPKIDKKDGFDYVRKIVNTGFSVDSLYSIVEDVSKRDIFYNMLFKNKKKVKKKIRKKSTNSDYEEIMQKTINNIINQKEPKYKKIIMNNLYIDELIDKYLYYYDLYMDKRNNISKNDYKEIVKNVLNIKNNFSRHNKIVSIYKEMNKYKLFSIKILYKYYTFGNIPKDKIVRFVYLLNEKLLDKLEKGELQLLNNNDYNSDNYDSEIEKDYQTIIKNGSDQESEWTDNE